MALEISTPVRERITMDRLEKYFYEGPGALQGPVTLQSLRRLNLDEIMKQDPMLTTTVGVWAALLGKRVWSQLNYEANAFAAVGKKPWDRTGWRVKTTKAATSGGGIAEDGTLPATIKGAYLPLEAKPKLHVNTWDASEIADLLSQVDDAIDILATQREDAGLTHRELINRALLKEFGTLPGYTLESFDRMIASTAERVACGEHDGDEDPWGTAALDRSAQAWSDSNVLHNSNVDRVLSLTLIDQLFRTIMTASGEKPHFILTGIDTEFAWGALLQAQARFFEPMTAIPSYNGVQAAVAGTDGAFNINSYQKLPIITSQHVAVDSISRIYMMNENYMWLKVLKPSRYFETGDPFILNSFMVKGLYQTVAELACTFFKAHGKIRDLKS